MDVKKQEVEYYTVREVADKFRISKMTVYRLLRTGALPGIRVGRSFRVSAQAVDGDVVLTALAEQPSYDDQYKALEHFLDMEVDLGADTPAEIAKALLTEFDVVSLPSDDDDEDEENDE